MPTLSGRLTTRGPFIDVIVMASPQRVAKLKAAGLPFPAPMQARVLLDTGASGCLVDHHIVNSLGLEPRGSVSVHTSSTGSDFIAREQFDACLVVGATDPVRKSYVVPVIGTDLGSEGFSAIIGWDILMQCVLTCDGPSRQFTLSY